MSDDVINIKNLVKRYGKDTVLNDVSFNVKEGSIVGLIGPNGAGKTTIMKIIGGLVNKTEGSLSIFNKSDEKGLSDSRRNMSFIIEEPYIKGNMSAFENLKKQCIQKGITDDNRIDEVLKFVKLDNTGNKPAKSFSLGMKQRLGIANALLSKPKIMVLDEPINGLDPKGIVEIRELLLSLNKEHKTTIVISSHILSELELLCSNFIFVNKGKIKGEYTLQELSDKCNEYYYINTSDNDKAFKVICDIFKYEKIERVDNGAIKLYEGTNNILKISMALYEAGSIPVELVNNKMNLEEFYLKLIED